MSAPEEPVESAVASREAGGKVIRGGTLRTGGYVVGILLVAASSVVILRYLGVEDFGRYITVMSILAIVSGVTDAGLTIVGQREYTITEDPAERRRMLADLIGLRLVLTPIGVLLAVGFAAVAGYSSELVLGTLVGGIGIVVLNAAVTATLPLSVELRFGALTATEVTKNLVIVAGFLLLVALGAGLVAFFAVQIAAGVAVAAMTLALVGAASRIPPRFAWRESRALLLEAAPIAVASVLNVVYVRILVVMMSLISSAEQTGLFGTSYRIVETFGGIPTFMIGAAFPVLAHAGHVDRARLAYALQRLGEASLLVAAGIVVGLVVGAEPIVRVLGGSEYLDAVPVLRVQAFALLGAFMTQVWLLGLVAIRRQRALMVTNALALVSVLVLGFVLLPLADAQGGAIAAAAGEGILAVTTLVMLVRASRELRPQLLYVPKIGAALGAALLAGLLLPLPDAVATVIALAVFIALAFVLRTVPEEIKQALLSRRR